jgi:hypothetical protein
MSVEVIGPDVSVIPQIVSDILDITGRSVLFHYVLSHSVCPVCAGADPFCLTCQGNPFVEVLGTYEATAAVKWKIGQLPERKRYRPEGQYLDGDCQLTIAYSEDLIPVLDATRKVVLDNRDCTIKSYYFRGEPAVNRVYVILNEDKHSDDSYRV